MPSQLQIDFTRQRVPIPRPSVRLRQCRDMLRSLMLSEILLCDSVADRVDSLAMKIDSLAWKQEMWEQNPCQRV